MRRITLPLSIIGAVVAGLIGLAAPAHAESVQTTPLRTLSSGLCVGEVQVTAWNGSEPGTVGISVPPVSSLFGISGLSGACSFDLIVRWRNLDTGATGTHQIRETVGSPGCDIWVCSAWQIRPGFGRVAIEVASNLPHVPGSAEIFVP
ncbi:hypothetical protein [Nocardia sienata]|uniref:hypothetical protein n=1 Tax=Nocardia sienata TaxID=248552 RepID=UPI000AD32573|nr:hypothetical protein [Nocardia sienata]